MTRYFISQRRRPSCGGTRCRRGAVLVVTLVAMLVVMALVGGMLKSTLRARRQLLVERDLRQTELLLQAGIDRAAYRLARATDYRGETWDLPADEIVGRGDGRVTISASRSAGGEPWDVHVVAEYPVGDASSIRRSHTFTIEPQRSQAEE